MARIFIVKTKRHLLKLFLFKSLFLMALLKAYAGL